MARVDQQVRIQDYGVYKAPAISDPISGALALRQNERNYAEAEAKRAEQAKIQQELYDLQAGALPRRLQGEINYDVDNLYESVRKGELRTDDYEFLSQLNRIKSKYNNYKNTVAQVQSAATGDGKYLFVEDDEGNVVNGRDQFVSSVVSSMNEDYNPETGTWDEQWSTKIAPVIPTIQKDLGFKFENIDSTIKDFYNRGTQEQAQLYEAATGFKKKSITSGLNAEERMNLAKSLYETNKAGMNQRWADAGGQRTGKSAEQWAVDQILTRMPESSREEDFVTDTGFTSRDRAGSGSKGTSPFELTTVSVREGEGDNANIIDYKMWGAGDEVIDGVKVAGVVWKDGKLLPKTVDMGVTDNESLAINYINKKNASFDAGEKQSKEDIIAQLKQTSAETRAFDEALFADIDAKLQSEGSFYNDDEEAVLKYIEEKTGFDFTSSAVKTDPFAKELRKLIDDTDFEDAEERKAVIDFLKTRLPVTTVRAKDGDATQKETISW